jgi:hypothetical protein
MCLCVCLYVCVCARSHVQACFHNHLNHPCQRITYAACVHVHWCFCIRARAHTLLNTQTHRHTDTLLRIYEPVSRFRGPNRALGTGGTRAPGPRMIRSRAWRCVSSFPGEAPSLFVSEGGGEAGSRGGSLALAASSTMCSAAAAMTRGRAFVPACPSASRLARVHAR